MVVKIRVLLGLGCALGLGCGTRISSTEGAASVASAAIAPAAVNPQFSGSDPLPRLSLDGPIRPRAPSPTAPPEHAEQPEEDDL